MKVKYYSDKEKGITTAVLELEPSERNVVVDIANVQTHFWLCDTDNLILRHTYSGVARLREGDVWNEEYGKMIARRKAYGKYLTAKVNKMMSLIDIVHKDRNNLLAIADKWIAKEEAYWDETVDLLGIEY